MTIANFGDLKTAFANYAARSDLTSYMADFVTLSETIFNYGHGNPGDGDYIAPLRVKDMVTGPSAIAITSNLAAIPADHLETIKVQTNATPATDLTYISPESYQEFYPSGDSTLPKFYTVIGTNIYVTSNIKLTYYAKLTTITSGDSATNWLLTASPGVYLHAGLFQLYAFMQAAEKAVAHRTMLLSYMNGLRQTDMFSRAGTFVRRSSMTAF